MDKDISRVTIDGVSYVSEYTIVFWVVIIGLFILCLLLWSKEWALKSELKTYEAFIDYTDLHDRFDKYKEQRDRINGDK